MPCPLGALSAFAGARASEVAQWLEAIGLIRHEHGRWVGDERYLCHSAQERLFVPDGGLSALAPRGFWASGQWQDGWCPKWAGRPLTRQSTDGSAERITRMQVDLGFAMPTWRRAWSAGLEALDRISFAQWLNQEGFSSTTCYGCSTMPVAMTSGAAWLASQLGRASITASRHGF